MSLTKIEQKVFGDGLYRLQQLVSDYDNPDPSIDAQTHQMNQMKNRDEMYGILRELIKYVEV